jgi:ketosteroid isomerase-like protein
MPHFSRFAPLALVCFLSAGVVLASWPGKSCPVPCGQPPSCPVLPDEPAALGPSPDEDRAAIRKVLDDQVAAWNKADLQAFMAGYWQSDRLSFYSGKTRTGGYQATLDRYRTRYQAEGKEMGQLRFDLFDVELLGPGVAVVRGRYLLKMKKEQPQGLFTLLLRRLPEGWRIVHDHTSS